MFDWAGVEGIEAEELAVLPGLDEVFALADMADHADSGDWDVIVVDCAPTAETIRLLSLPDVLGWYMDRLFPVGRRLNKVVAPVLGRVTSLPVAGDEVFSAGQQVYDRLDAVRTRCWPTASARASAWSSTPSAWSSPRPGAPTPTSRCSATASTPWSPTGCCPTPSTTRGSTSGRRPTPSSSTAIDEGFAPVPILRSELRPSEPIGVEALAVVRRRALRRPRPHRGAARGATRCGWRATTAPGASSRPCRSARRDELALARRDDELIISVGPYRRAIVLPDSLRSRQVTDARLEDGELVVEFS